ncbi:MAG: cupin domain-containing protein [Anaerolineales bacterium]|nr:cupin domain-containing protein [Anaerolineales bacterium]
MEKVNLGQKFDLIEEYWDPKIVGELNGQMVKIAKIQGEFIWHLHEDAEEFFYLFQGSMSIRLRDKDVALGEGEFFIVPRGVEHKPVAEEEAWIVMFEPAGTLNTGNVESELTRKGLEFL